MRASPDLRSTSNAVLKAIAPIIFRAVTDFYKLCPFKILAITARHNFLSLVAHNLSFYHLSYTLLCCQLTLNDRNWKSMARIVFHYRQATLQYATHTWQAKTCDRCGKLQEISGAVIIRAKDTLVTSMKQDSASFELLASLAGTWRTVSMSPGPRSRIPGVSSR